MIDHPRTADEAILRSIWKEVFNDTDEFVDSFFGRRYSADSTLVYRERGEIVSMIFFPRYNFKVNDARFGLGYICGAATLPGYRQKGLMGLLMEASLEAMRSRGDSFSSLIPASDPLYEYYSRFGFRDYFFRKRYSLTRESVNAGPVFSLQPMSDFNTLYRLYLSGVNTLTAAVVHGYDSYSAVADEFTMTGGEILVSNDQRLYCFVRVTGETAFIRELFGESVSSSSYTEMVAALMKYFPDIRNVHIECPSELGVPAAERFRTGMARGLSGDMELQLVHVTGAYMKFMLED
ncbi:MAG: GNAT family N-acetyltransferase [Bacteroidales bacterium]